MPHNLSAQQRNDQLKQSRELLEVPQNAKRLQWKFIVTEDESRFFYVNEYQKLWLAPDPETPEVARRRINTPEVMVLLFWNISGLHVSNFLASKSFDAGCFVHNVLTPIHHIPIVDVAHKQKKRFILHMDNSPIHKSKVTRAKLFQIPVHLAPHPLYSPDLAPSNFFLFGYPKTKMVGPKFDSPEVYLTGSRPNFRG
jgi:hypothetical protein